MYELTPRQYQVLELIRKTIEQNGMPPTRAEIALGLGFKSPNAAEDHLRASGIDHVIVRPGGLVHEYEPGERGLKMAQGLDQLAMVHRYDVAAVVVAALQDPAAVNTTFELVSDADAEPDAWRSEFASLTTDYVAPGDMKDPPRN